MQCTVYTYVSGCDDSSRQDNERFRVKYGVVSTAKNGRGNEFDGCDCETNMAKV